LRVFALRGNDFDMTETENETKLTEHVGNLVRVAESAPPRRDASAKSMGKQMQAAAEKLREWGDEFVGMVDELWAAADELHDSTGREAREDAHEQLVAVLADLLDQLAEVGARRDDR
jgi:hypothetical protein